MQYEVIGMEHLKGHKKDGSGDYEFYRVHLLATVAEETEKCLGKVTQCVVLSPLPYANAKISLGSVVGEPAYKKDSTSCVGFLPAE